MCIERISGGDDEAGEEGEAEGDDDEDREKRKKQRLITECWLRRS